MLYIISDTDSCGIRFGFLLKPEYNSLYIFLNMILSNVDARSLYITIVIYNLNKYSIFLLPFVINYLNIYNIILILHLWPSTLVKFFIK